MREGRGAWWNCWSSPLPLPHQTGVSPSSSAPGDGVIGTTPLQGDACNRPKAFAFISLLPAPSCGIPHHR